MQDVLKYGKHLNISWVDKLHAYRRAKKCHKPQRHPQTKYFRTFLWGLCVLYMISPLEARPFRAQKIQIVGLKPNRQIHKSTTTHVLWEAKNKSKTKHKHRKLWVTRWLGGAGTFGWLGGSMDWKFGGLQVW